MPLLTMLRRLLTEEDGPTAVEYAIMLAFIILVAFVTIQTLGQSANAVFNDAASGLSP